MTAETHFTAIIYKYDNSISRLADWEGASGMQRTNAAQLR
jgi:hypothetical protein